MTYCFLSPAERDVAVSNLHQYPDSWKQRLGETSAE